MGVPESGHNEGGIHEPDRALAAASGRCWKDYVSADTGAGPVLFGLECVFEAPEWKPIRVNVNIRQG